MGQRRVNVAIVQRDGIDALVVLETIGGRTRNRFGVLFLRISSLFIDDHNRSWRFNVAVRTSFTTKLSNLVFVGENIAHCPTKPDPTQ